MKQKTLLTTLGLLAIFMLYLPPAKAPHTPSKKERTADQITAKVAKRLEKEKNLVPVGSGGAMFYEVTMLGLAFQYHRVVNLEEARELLTYAIQIFLEEVNANEDIRPYLIQYPFKAENIEMELWIQKLDRSDVEKDQLFLLCSDKKGRLNYFLRSEDPSEFKLLVHQETFEEAVEILNKVKDSSSSISSQAVSTPTNTTSPTKKTSK